MKNKKGFVFMSIPRSRIIVMAVFPRIPEEIRQKIDRLNQLIRQYFDGTGRSVAVLDISRRFLNADGSFNALLYQDSRCHPNNAGYRIWAEALKPFLPDKDFRE